MNSYEVFVDHQLELVKITATGEFDRKDGEEIVALARTTAAEHDYNVLYDIRQATITTTIANWYFIPREFPVLKNDPTRSIKAAVLVSPKDKALKDYEFYKLTSSNVGLQIQIFFDMSAAVEWLQREKTK